MMKQYYKTTSRWRCMFFTLVVLDQLATWSERWQIPFNVNKRKVLKIGKNDQIVKYSMGTLEGKIELEQVQHEKDLGVIFDTDLKFSQHIHENIKQRKSEN